MRQKLREVLAIVADVLGVIGGIAFLIGVFETTGLIDQVRSAFQTSSWNVVFILAGALLMALDVAVRVWLRRRPIRLLSVEPDQPAPAPAQLRVAVQPPPLAAQVTPSPRESCKLSPRELVRLFDQGGTELQAQSLVEAYVGQWREVAGTVREVTQHNQYVLGVMATDSDNVTLSLFFDPDQWAEQLRGLMSGDPIKAFGKVQSVRKGHVLFHDCEVVE